jgi:biotin carboxyl carrier protein
MGAARGPELVKYHVVVEGRSFEVEIHEDGSVWVDRRLCDVDLTEADGQPCHSLLLDNRSFETQVRPGENGEWQVVVAGRPYRTSIDPPPECASARGGALCPPPDQAAAAPHARAQVKAPLPGVLVEVRVADGDYVDEGDVVAVLESMKMHLELCSPRAGVVSALAAQAGHEVDLGEVLAIVA